MSKTGWGVRIAGYGLAPFTGGWSVPIANAGAAGIEAKQHSNDGPKPAKGGKNPEDPLNSILKQYSEQSQQKGESLSGQGEAAVSPALKYYRDLLSPNASDLMAATAPERGRVIDQYDTARKAVAQFGPRGGGTTGALAESRFDQAESMGDITSQARRGAAGGSAELGLQLESLGLSHEALASQDIGTIIQSILNRQYLDVTKRGQTMQAWSGVGQMAGQFLGMYLTREGGALGQKSA